MDTENASGAGNAARPKPPAAAPAGAEAVAYEACLLMMARATECAGLYGAAHPSTQCAVDEWYRHLAPILRMHGAFALSAEGAIASINGMAIPVTNPAILSLLQRLYTTRAGRLELLSGLQVEAAGRLTAFLADADTTRVAGEDRSLETWLERTQLRHVRVTPIRLLEIKEGDRVVAGEPQHPSHRPAAPEPGAAPPPAPTQVAAWARQFKREAGQSGSPAALPRESRHLIITALRGSAGTPPADLPEPMARAARNAPELAGLILKCALVGHELAREPGNTLGPRVVAGLRVVLDALQRTPAAAAPDGWHDAARTLSALEACVLERLQPVAGGTDGDAEAIRSGVRKMLREIEAAALQKQYEQKRGELLAMERKMGQLRDDGDDGNQRGAG